MFCYYYACMLLYLQWVCERCTMGREVKLEYRNTSDLICKNCYSYYQIINEKSQATPNNNYTEERVNDSQHSVVLSTTM